jgi:hypothetical protein
MRNFRRLPPVLRVASLLGLLFPLGMMVAFTMALVTTRSSSPQAGVYASRVAVIAANLGAVGMASAFVVNTYCLRFRPLSRQPFPLESWKSQVRAILMPAVAPIGAMVLATVIPPTSSAFQIVFPISIIGVGVCLVVSYTEYSRREVTG